MIRTLALRIVEAAAWLQPTGRHGWGEAMRAEFDHVADDRAALEFATGCLLAAARGRITMGLLETTGRWGVGLFTAWFGAYHLWCASNIARAIGGKADGWAELLERRGSPYLDTYLASRPLLLAYMLAMGLTYAAAGWFLLRGQSRQFLMACAAATAVAATVTVAGIIQVAPFRGMGWQFLPVVMLLAAWLLIERRRVRLELG